MSECHYKDDYRYGSLFDGCIITTQIFSHPVLGQCFYDKHVVVKFYLDYSYFICYI